MYETIEMLNFITIKHFYLLLHLRVPLKNKNKRLKTCKILKPTKAFCLHVQAIK